MGVNRVRSLASWLLLLLVTTCGSTVGRATALTNADGQQGREKSTTMETELATTDEQAAPSSGKSPESTVKSICKNRAVPIQSTGEMLRLIKAIDRDEWRCHDNYMAAIYELEPILMQPKERLCEDLGWALMKRYHFRFIQPHVRANRAPTEFDPAPREVFKGQLHPEPRKYTLGFDEHSRVLFAPLSVRHFWLKFALQVSHQCKMNLVKNLAKDQERILKPDDMELMRPFAELLLGPGASGQEQQKQGQEQQRTQLQPKATGSPKLSINFDNVLYLPELDGRMLKDGEKMEETGGEQRHLRTNAALDSGLVKMISACKSRFKPMYDSLFIPIVRLSKLGYDYQGPMGWSEGERKFLEGDLVRLWLVTVHVCESFKNTVLVQLDEAQLEKGLEAEKDRSKSGLRDALNSIEDEEDHEEPQEQGRAPPEGKLSAISADEEAELRASGKWPEELMKPVDYAPSKRFRMADQLMIRTVRELDLELSRKEGHTNPFGFFGRLRRLSGLLKAALAKLDPDRFAHYRNNAQWYSGVLNFFSSLSNVASITVTFCSILMSTHG